MNYRISLSLALVAGCSGEINVDISNTDGSQGSTSAQTTGDTGATSPGTATEDLPTSDTSASDTEQSGSHSASQTCSGTTQDTAGTASTSDPGTASTTGETTGDTTGETTGETTGTTGGCMPKVDGPAPVVLGMPDDLGTPGAYAVLAKTAVTSVPGTSIDGGNVGVSPAAASAITGFSLVLDPSGVFATSTTVVTPYKVYAASYTIPTPSLLTTAVLGMQAAYINAASRVPTDYLDLKDGDIGGLILEPGIYTWGSAVVVPDDVTLEGCEDDVWILQIAGNLDVSTGKSVLLAGGARAENVFWQVAGKATIHANAHFEGIILSKTDIIFQTEASLHGRALAQAMATFDKNMITAPSTGS